MTTDDLAGQITALLTGWGLSPGRVVSRLDAQTMASALVKLWPDTPPTSPLPDPSHPIPAHRHLAHREPHHQTHDLTERHDHD